MVVATLADQAHIARDGRFATASKPQLLGDQRCGFAIVFDAQDLLRVPAFMDPAPHVPGYSSRRTLAWLLSASSAKKNARD